MSLTRTSLSSSIAATQTKGLPITSTSSGFPAVGVLGSRQVIQIDSEFMLIDQVVSSGVVDVLMRGYNGSAAVAHDTLAPVVTSSANSDFSAMAVGAVVSRPPALDLQVTCGQNGAIAVPVQNTTVLLTKATALSATTLAAPSVDNDGVRLTLTSVTAAAHVITATTLLADAVSGSPHTTATFAAFKGASLVLEASNGLWNVVSSVGVTIT